MIIYVGDEYKGGFIREVFSSKEDPEDIKFLLPVPNIADLVDPINLAASSGGLKYIIYDVDEFIDPPEVIIREMDRLKKGTGSEPILLVPSLSAGNQIVAAATDSGFKLFIDNTSTMADKKSQLLKCVSGYYKANGRKELQEIEKLKEEQLAKQGSFKTIGVMGACHRMGTTTQAIQIVKYLQNKGYKACYVEMNDILYPNLQLARREKPEISFVVKADLSMESQFEDKDIGLVTIEGVDMYYKQAMLSEILEKDYDFYVYDYGVYTDKNFNRASFLKDDINVIATGANVVELDYTINILMNTPYNKAKLVFSFTAEGDRPDFLSFFNDQPFQAGERCFFAEFAPNPFILTNYELYDSMFDLEYNPNSEDAPPPEPKKKKRGLFKKK